LYKWYLACPFPEIEMFPIVVVPFEPTLIDLVVDPYVAFREVAVAAPNTGLTKVGELAKTLLPVPVFATLIRFLEPSVATA
jgi:hypothetical protein